MPAISYTWRAEMVPMLTWSSVLAEDGIVSTLAGCASTLFSLTSAAEVYCTSMKPELIPPSRVRKAGSRLRFSF